MTEGWYFKDLAFGRTACFGKSTTTADIMLFATLILPQAEAAA